MEASSDPPGLRPPGPLDVQDAFGPERDALLTLLRALGPDDWARPTMCDGWSVRDLVAHLVADDLGRLSGQRDGHRDGGPAPDRPLVEWIDQRNDAWVVGTRRLSGPVLVSLLEVGGTETAAFFRSLDPTAPGVPVSWAELQATPMWLDLARELTERWHHQAQLRDALGAPLLDEPGVLGPVHAAFAFGLPATFRGLVAAAGTTVVLAIPGPAGGAWTVISDGAGRWTLWAGEPTGGATARVALPASEAWRMYCRIAPAERVRAAASIEGDAALAERLLRTVSIVA